MTMDQRRRRTVYTAGGVLSLAVVGLVAFLIVVLFRASSQIRALNTASVQQQAQVDGLAGAVGSARAQIQSLGATPVVAPPSEILKTVTVTGAPGAQGPGPSDAQVAAAVAAYLQQHPVPGPSAQEIATAVTAYLIATPPPSGPAGAQGPGPSDQQIADAVASYMAANPAPSGPAGPPGAAGKDGTDGQNGSPPAGFSFTDPNGNSYSCTPDDQTPAPHYTCNPVVTSSPTGSATATTTGAGANPADETLHTVRPRPTSSTPAPAPTVTRGKKPPSPAPSPTGSSTPGPGSSPLSRILAALGIPALRREDLYIL